MTEQAQIERDQYALLVTPIASTSPAPAGMPEIRIGPAPAAASDTNSTPTKSRRWVPFAVGGAILAGLGLLLIFRAR